MEDLLHTLQTGVAGLDARKLIQIGMDGPNVNLKLHRLFAEDRKKIDPDLPELIDIGTSSLHVVHGALQTGIKKNSWELDQLLKSLWWLFLTLIREGQYILKLLIRLCFHCSFAPLVGLKMQLLQPELLRYDQISKSM